MLTALLALGAAFGLCCLVWMIYGWLLLSGGRDCAVSVRLSAAGDGVKAEATLRALGWLTASGLLRGRIEVTDGGLTEEGRTRLLRAVRGKPHILLIRRPQEDSERH